jgi:hypothetical protein
VKRTFHPAWNFLIKPGGFGGYGEAWEGRRAGIFWWSKGDETRERERERGMYVIDPLLDARYCRQRRQIQKTVPVGKR